MAPEEHRPIRGRGTGDGDMEATTTYKIGQRFEFKRGDRVICNGYPGTVQTVYTDKYGSMVDVRLERGEVCVSASYPTCYPAPAN
jgi:hypothetical protein